MGAGSEIEPRTSMERHLMDRDREGQLYLEARRQQAAVDLLKNRTSFLSTITPPSTNPSSAASSLYHEPADTSSVSSSSQQLPPTSLSSVTGIEGANMSMPNTPTSPLTNMSSAAPKAIAPPGISLSPLPTSSYPSYSSSPAPVTTTTTSATTTTNTTHNTTTTVLSSLAPPLQNIVPVIKKTRQRAATGPGRNGRGTGAGDLKVIPDRPVLPISPSSLEYQLTANLLNYHPPAANASPSSSARQSSRPRSKTQQQQQQQPPTTKKRRHTVNKDARIETTASSRGTGHKQQQQNQNRHRHHDSNGSNGSNGSKGSNNSNNNSNNKGEDYFRRQGYHHTAAQPMTPQEWTPISLLGSYTPSPTSGNQGPTDTNPSFVAAAASSSSPPGPRVVSGPLPSLPPSPPLPPLPPKSPSALIAQYFPRSLPLPPSKGRAPYGQREAVVAPTPFKTPTFGPALVSTTPTTTHPDAPPLPSPSASFHYIPSADTSRTSTSHAAHNPHHNHHLQHNEEDTSDFSSSSNRPSPNPSAIGLHQGSSSATTPTTVRMMPHQQHPGRLPSDLDLILHNSRHCPGLARSTNTTNTKNAGSISSEGLEVAVVSPIPTTPTPILLFAPPRPRSPAGVRASPSTTLLSNPAIPPRPTTLPTTPIYPRGLASSSMLPDSTQVIIRLHQKPVPYIRELVPGKETGPAIVTNGNSIAIATASPTTVPVVLEAVEPSSANTSRDLELVLDEITGRLKTNRTSIDPWTFTFSPWDEKPLPPVRRERGARYWVFRDQDGLVPGPILFLVGHLFPPLWWVGSLYPRLEHPDETAVAKAEMEAHAASVAAVARAHAHAQAQVEGEEDNDASDRQNGVALQWLHRQLKTLGVSVASITLSASSSKPQQGNDDSNSNTIATLQMVEVPYDNHYHSSSANEREGSTLATHVSRPPLPPPPMLPMSSPSILDSRGPWAARGSNASSLFEQRMAYDRKVLRYELDLRWRRINLVWSFVSLLLAISAVAIVYGVRK